MEKDDEIQGNGNSYNTHFRHYDPRLGRWASVDPEEKENEGQSPYCGLDNNPISVVDPEGNSGKDYLVGIAVGWLTDVIPSGPGVSSFWRSQYTPDNPQTYNNALEGTDNVMNAQANVMMGAGAATTVVGVGTMIAGGGATATVAGAVVGVPAAAAGGVITTVGVVTTGAGGLLKSNIANNRKDGYHYGEKPAQAHSNSNQTQNSTQNTTQKVNGNSTKSEKPSGSYTNTHQSGKTYSGKGEEPRMNQSAKRIEKNHNDPVVKQDYSPAKNTKEAYIQEHNRIQQNGGAGNNQKNYNLRESPGKKLSGK